MAINFFLSTPSSLHIIKELVFEDYHWVFHNAAIAKFCNTSDQPALLHNPCKIYSQLLFNKLSHQDSPSYVSVHQHDHFNFNLHMSSPSVRKFLALWRSDGANLAIRTYHYLLVTSSSAWTCLWNIWILLGCSQIHDEAIFFFFNLHHHCLVFIKLLGLSLVRK